MTTVHKTLDDAKAAAMEAFEGIVVVPVRDGIHRILNAEGFAEGAIIQTVLLGDNDN
jgi:hypothetical protein